MSFVLVIPEIAPKGEKAYAFSIAPAWLREAMEGTGYGAADVPEGQSEDEAGGRLELTARKMGDDVLVDAHARATLRVPCARCNEDIDWPVDVAFTQLFVPRSAYAEQHDEEEVELSPEDLERETYVGDEIVLDAIVREHLILEVPMTPRCPQGCADPAIAEYLDRPREKKAGPLAGLLDLKDKLDEEES